MQESLERRIRDTILLSFSPPRELNLIGENALTSFLSLPGIEEWRFQKSWAGLGILKALEIGLMFSCLGNNISIENRKKRIADVLTRKEPLFREETLNPSQKEELKKEILSDYSETEIGALLSYLGGEVYFVERKEGIRTADIHLGIKEESIDVEVTRSNMRDLEKKIKTSLDNFASALTLGDIEHNLIFSFPMHLTMETSMLH